jgi:hypothetical protein
MLSVAELRQAEELLTRLREVVAAPLPEFTKDGQELADLLRCCRSKSWQVTKRADFQQAAPAVTLGPKLKLRRTAQILIWWQSLAENQNPRPPSRPGADDVDGFGRDPRRKRGHGNNARAAQYSSRR